VATSSDICSQCSVSDGNGADDSTAVIIELSAQTLVGDASFPPSFMRRGSSSITRIMVPAGQSHMHAACGEYASRKDCRQYPAHPHGLAGWQQGHAGSGRRHPGWMDVGCATGTRVQQLTRSCRVAAFGRWPPRAMKSVSREGRWTALRRPDGRLPGRRQAQNVKCQHWKHRRTGMPGRFHPCAP